LVLSMPVYASDIFFNLNINSDKIYFLRNAFAISDLSINFARAGDKF
jgi:hypothetical protein